MAHTHRQFTTETVTLKQGKEIGIKGQLSINAISTLLDFNLSTEITHSMIPCGQSARGCQCPHSAILYLMSPYEYSLRWPKSHGESQMISMHCFIEDNVWKSSSGLDIWEQNVYNVASWMFMHRKKSVFAASSLAQVTYTSFQRVRGEMSFCRAIHETIVILNLTWLSF